MDSSNNKALRETALALLICLAFAVSITGLIALYLMVISQQTGIEKLRQRERELLDRIDQYAESEY